MRLLLISAAAVALAFASPALAQDHHGDKGHGGENHGANNAGSNTTPAKPAPQHVTRPRPAVTHNRAPHTPGAPNAANTWRGHNGMLKTTASPTAAYNNATQNNNRHSNNRHDNNQRGGTHWNNNGSHNKSNNHQNNNYNNRNKARGNSHANFNRRNVTARHHYRYRGKAWRWPSGHSYRRWTFGMTLPSIFWANNYWINDYSYYGLGTPPFGTVWVRYGNDAILIDRYSGEILEVVYGQFY